MKHHQAPSSQRSRTEVLLSPRDWPLSMKLVIVFAIVSRLAFLGWKAPHFDESINGHFVDTIWKNGFFKYDPSNFHGPMYFYILHLAETILGRGVETFRFITGILSIGCVVVAALHSRYLGRAALWAAIVLALSPAMMFYGRYAIHETLFVLGQLIFSYGFLRWRFEGGRSAVVWMGLGVVATITTKETFFIFFGTWLIAWTLMKISEGHFPRALRSGEAWPAPRAVGGERVWWWAVALGTFFAFALFSGFFVYPKGISDMFSAFAFWAQTGAGASGHEKSFWYWLELLLRYEWPTLIALVVAPVVCLVGSFWMRVYTLVGFGLWLAYSIIPYKTPWCLISFSWPLAFAYGFLITEMRAKLTAQLSRAFALCFAIFLLAVSGVTALRLSFRDFEKFTEPYVYVQTSQDVPQVMQILEGRVKREPEVRTLRVQVLHKDSWPFPWLLARFPNTKFSLFNASTEPTADVIFADATDSLELEKKLQRTYFKRQLHIRDSYPNGYAYFETKGFAAWFTAETIVVGPETEESAK